MWVPGVSLLDGIAYDYGEKKKFIKSVHNFENDILVASRNIAKRYSTGKDHIKGTTDIALTIFDSMKKVHGMGARERLLLQIAVQLHDCGKYISMADVAECSYRIIMATEIIGLSTEERKVIASAVRYNTTEFVYYGNYDEGPEIDREQISFGCETDCNPSSCKCHGPQPLSEGGSIESGTEGQRTADDH